jgi:hypothetical protein
LKRKDPSATTPKEERVSVENVPSSVEVPRPKEDATTTPLESAERNSDKNISQDVRKSTSRNAGTRKSSSAEPDQSAIATSTVTTLDSRSVKPPTPLSSDKDVKPLASPNTPKDVSLNPPSNAKLTLNGVVERLPEPLLKTTRT